jgi:hypothetical protein
MPGKRMQIDQETWNALDLLGQGQHAGLPGTGRRGLHRSAPQAGRPVDLKTALRQSVSEIEKRPAAAVTTKVALA